MVGVTLSSPQYENLTFEAVRRFKRHTGLDVQIMWSDGEPAYAHKLEAAQRFKGRSVVFFDVDWWALRPMDLGQFNNSPHFVCVRDPGVFDHDQFPHTDSAVLGIDELQYFNSGFWIANFRRPDHVAAFEAAAQLCEEKLNGLWTNVGDPGEQSFLNAGIQRSGCSVLHLPFAYNCYNLAVRFGCYPEYPREIFGLHAAGVHHSEKREWLELHERVFGDPRPETKTRPLTAAAQLFYSA